MLKSISNLGKELNKSEKEQVNGGFGPVLQKGCLAPYFKGSPEEQCITGYHPHPTMGHCICCRD